MEHPYVESWSFKIGDFKEPTPTVIFEGVKTVGELIAFLEKYDKHAPIGVRIDGYSETT